MISLRSLDATEKKKMMHVMSSVADDDIQFEIVGDKVVATMNVPNELSIQHLVEPKSVSHPSHSHGSIQNTTTLCRRPPDLSEVQGEVRAVQWTIKLIEDIWSHYCKGISEGSSDVTGNLYSFIFHYFTHKFGLDSIVENTFADLIYNSQRYYHISTVCEIFCMLINGEYNDLDLRFFAIARSHLVGASISEVRAVQASDSNRHNVLRRFVPIRELPYLMKRVLFKHPHASYVRSRVGNWIESPDTVQISPRALVKAGHVDCYELLRFLLSIYADNPRDIPLQTVDVNSVSNRRPQSTKPKPTHKPSYTMSASDVVDVHVPSGGGSKSRKQPPPPAARRRQHENERIVVRDIEPVRKTNKITNNPPGAVAGAVRTQNVFRKSAMLEMSHRSVSETSRSDLGPDGNQVLVKELNEYFAVHQEEVQTATSEGEFTRRSSFSTCDNETESNATARPTDALRESTQAVSTIPVDEDLIFGIAKVPTATTESWRSEALNNNNTNNTSLRQPSTSLPDSAASPPASSKFVASPQYGTGYRFDSSPSPCDDDQHTSHSTKEESDCCPNDTIESNIDDNNENCYSNTKWDQQYGEDEEVEMDAGEGTTTSPIAPLSKPHQTDRSHSGGSLQSAQSRSVDEPKLCDQNNERRDDRSLSGGSAQRTASDELPASVSNQTSETQRGRWSSFGGVGADITSKGSALVNETSPKRSNWRLNEPNALSPQRSPARWRLSTSESPQSENKTNDFSVDLAEDKSPRRGGTWRDASRAPALRQDTDTQADLYNLSNITTSTSSDDVEVNLAKLQAEVSHLKKLQARLQGTDADTPNNDDDEKSSNFNEKSIISQKCDPETEEMDSVPAELLGEGGLMIADKEADIDSDDRQFYSSLTAALQRRKERDRQQQLLSRDSPPKTSSRPSDYDDDIEFHPNPRESTGEAITSLEKLALSDSF